MIHFLSGVEVCKFRNKKYQTNSHTHTYKSNVHVYIFLEIFSKIKLSSINHSTFEILFAYFCESKLNQISSMSRMKPFESEYYFIAFHLTGYTLVSPTEVRDTFLSLINSTAGRNSAIAFNRPHFRYWTRTSLQLRLIRGVI